MKKPIKTMSVGVLERILGAENTKKLTEQYEEVRRAYTYGPRKLTEKDKQLFSRWLSFKGSMSEFARVEHLNPAAISGRLYRIGYLEYVDKVKGV